MFLALFTLFCCVHIANAGFENGLYTVSIDAVSSYGMLYIMSSDNNETNSTRLKILSSTCKLMEERRGINVKMGDIAEDAGISRQALYLHFASRTELMVATVGYIDEIKGVSNRIASLDHATCAIVKLEEFMFFWGNYIPEIYGLAKALLNTRHTDKATAQAWESCMSHLRDMSQKVIESIYQEGLLVPFLEQQEASELFWALVSIQNWEQLTQECSWTTEQYIERMTKSLKHTFISPHHLT